MTKVYLDFETRSTLDVKKVGAHVYAAHPTTSIISLAYAVDDGPVALVKDCNDVELARLAADDTVEFHAHNAMFEQAIWHYQMRLKHRYRPIPIERWYCTAAKAAAMSMPRKLEKLAKALSLPVGKDMAGHKAMQKLSRPRLNSAWWEYDDCPETWEAMYAYNMTDVEVERLADRRLPDLSEREREIWVLDQRINWRGVSVDVQGVERAIELADAATDKMAAEFVQVTGQFVSSPKQVAKFQTWLRANDCDLPNLQKTTVARALAGDSLTPRVRRALELRAEMAKSSVSKYANLLRGTSEDGKARDLFMYAGGITKRWAGKRFQPQNLPRGKVNSDTAWQYINDPDPNMFTLAYSDEMSALSSAIRGSVIAPEGHELVVGDFASIEARVLAWVAGNERMLTLFRKGGDPYVDEACNIFSRTVTKKDAYERLIGKVAVLALGYNGGIAAFGTMANGYNVSLAPAFDMLWGNADEYQQERAKTAYRSYVSRFNGEDDSEMLNEKSGLAADIIKQNWRAANPEVVKLWKDVEAAAIEATRTGVRQYAANCTFGTISGGHLACRLPSGTCIIYPFVRLEERETPWGDVKTTLTYMHEKNGQWLRTPTYGGKLVENIVQGISRDILADAMLRIDSEGEDRQIVLHVHDEIGAVVPTGSLDLKLFRRCMTRVPSWAEGCPIDVEVWKGTRYKK